MSEPRIFVSFDIDHDEELYQRLVAESRIPASGFAVLGGSERLLTTDVWSDNLRSRICRADQLIVICGEHTEASVSVGAELRIAREERIPYFLLWGRREIMCTKPIGAGSAEGMYSWTRQILQDQIGFTLRSALADAAAGILRNAAPKS
jgi:hypothetical protein